MPCATPPQAAPDRPPCSAASSKGLHGQAAPGSSADRPHPPADAWRRNAAAHAASHARVGHEAGGRPATCAGRHAASAVRPRAPTNSGLSGRRSGCSASQPASASRTTGSTGTIRSLLPLPTTRSVASCPAGASRTSSASASPMRSPQPYSRVNKRRVTRLRRGGIGQFGDPFGHIAAPARMLGRAVRGAWRVASRSASARYCRPRAAVPRNRKKLRTAARCRARVALLAPSMASAASQARRSACRSDARAARSGSSAQMLRQEPKKCREIGAICPSREWRRAALPLQPFQEGNARFLCGHGWFRA